ncbi:hypothetical protein [uncultured Bradyrhizobium sp.]|mgnify:CR=1 FL=1|jgi:hypothetical protein|uniref:hypothetical protein n=1 Tax=uncultured Bradyrhizobium sp. TaxID=199684 RepID=UPI00262D31D0|nr:hypothetical protein [uncultured Bradyrhizobium sp.]
MMNVIQFHAGHGAPELPKQAGESAAHLTAALCASARDALSLLTGQFELAIQHARAIEPRIHDARMRQLFAERIELTQRLLDVAQLKILLLQFGSPTDHGRRPSSSER